MARYGVYIGLAVGTGLESDPAANHIWSALEKKFGISKAPPDQVKKENRSCGYDFNLMPDHPNSQHDTIPLTLITDPIGHHNNFSFIDCGIYFSIFLHQENESLANFLLRVESGLFGALKAKKIGLFNKHSICGSLAQKVDRFRHYIELVFDDSLIEKPEDKDTYINFLNKIKKTIGFDDIKEKKWMPSAGQEDYPQELNATQYNRIQKIDFKEMFGEIVYSALLRGIKYLQMPESELREKMRRQDSQSSIQTVDHHREDRQSFRHNGALFQDKNPHPETEKSWCACATANCNVM